MHLRVKVKQTLYLYTKKELMVVIALSYWGK
jgi:hypothetical protein